MSSLNGDTMDNILVDFVSGTDRPIERCRQFKLAELGGYDLIDINELNLCIKTMWIGRWKRETEMKDLSGVACRVNTIADHIGKRNDDPRMMINSEILRCWAKFKEKYYMYGNNILDAPIFNNDTLCGDNNLCIEEIVFLRQRREVMSDRATTSVISDVVEGNGVVKPKTDIEMVWDMDISWAEYFRLRAEIQRIIGSYPIDIEETTMRMSLENFVTSNIKGCKRYRSVLSGKNSKGYKRMDVKRIQPLVSL